MEGARQLYRPGQIAVGQCAHEEMLKGQNCFTSPEQFYKARVMPGVAERFKVRLAAGLSSVELLLLSLACNRCCKRECKKSWRWQPQNQLPTGKVCSKSYYSEVGFNPGALIFISPVSTACVCLLCVPTTITLNLLDVPNKDKHSHCHFSV